MPVVTRSKYAKIDFSKLKKRPVSEGFVFPKNTEQKLAEALDEIEKMKKQFNDMENEKNKTITWLMLDKADYEKCRSREHVAFKEFMADYKNLKIENEQLKKQLGRK